MADDEGEDDLLRAFAALPVGECEKRQTCERCKRPSSTCLCPYLPEKLLDIKTNIHILQHPKEEFRLLTTVPIIEACVGPEECQIHRERRFKQTEFTELHKVLEQPNSLLLYPGPEAVDIKTVDLSLYQNYNLFVLDGTWRQARNIFYGNPFLNDIKQVIVEHENLSEYVIRTQPTNKSLCTVEAVAIALSVLENNCHIYQVLINPLKALCQFQLDHGAVVHSSKELKVKEIQEETDDSDCVSRKTKRRRKRRQRLRNGQICEQSTESEQVEGENHLECNRVMVTVRNQHHLFKQSQDTK